MKKIVLIISVVFLSLIGIAQNNVTWLSIGARGGFGGSLLLNQPSLDDSNIDYEYFSPAYYYGGRFGLMFGDYIGLSAFLGLNSYSQGYVIHNSTDLTRTIQLNTFDYGGLLNLETPTGFYFEIGPKFSVINKATMNTSGDNTSSDRIQKFVPEYTSFTFGIGMKPIMTDVFEMKIGIKGDYSFANIVAEPGYIIPADDKAFYTPLYIDETTTPAQLMLSVEFTYVFGRFGKASCGKYNFKLNTL